MKKILYLVALTVIFSINILGCGKTEDSSGSSSNTSIKENSSINSNENNSSENNVTDNPSNTNEPVSDNNNNDNVNTTAPETTPEAEETKTPEIETAEISLTQPYSDINKVVTVLGLKEYKKLEGDKYTDKPGKGKKYLVMFLSIRNDSLEDYYINYKYLSAKVDGKKVENTFLVNEPKNYTTIFNNIEAGSSAAGFIVWEVPEDWKKFKMSYEGWKDIDNVSIKAEFTPKDLSDPLIYNANDYS